MIVIMATLWRYILPVTKVGWLITISHAPLTHLNKIHIHAHPYLPIVRQW